MSVDRPGPDHREIQELLGAYALDAVDADTAGMIDRHLDTCLRCSIEVAHHHEVAGLLANSGGESPPALWDGIAERLEGSAPPSWERLAARLETGAERVPGSPGVAAVPPAGPAKSEGPGGAKVNGHRRHGRGWVTAGAALVAAAAAVVSIVLGVRVDHLNHQVSSLTASAGLNAAERAALAEPATRQVQLTAPAGSGSPVTVTVVLTASGTGFVQAHGLPALAGNRTYQLWAVVGGQTISLGLLGPDPAVVPFSVAGGQPIHAFAITAEHRGGVVQTTQQPVVAGSVRT